MVRREIMKLREKSERVTFQDPKEVNGGAGEVRTPDVRLGIQSAVLIGVENF